MYNRVLVFPLCFLLLQPIFSQEVRKISTEQSNIEDEKYLYVMQQAAHELLSANDYCQNYRPDEPAELVVLYMHLSFALARIQILENDIEQTLLAESNFGQLDNDGKRLFYTAKARTEGSINDKLLLLSKSIDIAQENAGNFISPEVNAKVCVLAESGNSTKALNLFVKHFVDTIDIDEKFAKTMKTKNAPVPQFPSINTSNLVDRLSMVLSYDFFTGYACILKNMEGNNEKFWEKFTNYSSGTYNISDIYIENFREALEASEKAYDYQPEWLRRAKFEYAPLRNILPDNISSKAYESKEFREVIQEPWVYIDQ